VIKKLTADNDLSSQDKKVKLLNEVEPILEQMKAPKLNLLFRKRIAQLVGLDIQEINNILKNNIQTNIKRTNRKIAKRIPINPIRRFILFIIIKPELAIESDLKIFTSNENDHNLAKKIIQNALTNKENNAAVMLHFLESEIDQEQFKEIEEQIAKIDDDLSINDEVEALRESLQKKLLTSLNKTKLSEIQQKSLGSLTDEEKTFLKNFRRK